MNKDNAKDYLPLVQALADGKTIQYSASLISPAWADREKPNFYSEPEYYRIKPEPRECWIRFGANDVILQTARDENNAHIKEIDGFVRMREIIE